ncbi:MAG TPA: bile acid:sodium symporter [Pirellulales bacterium]|nr:bile acid:sodium symporter [Pirellulales bacterium]
MFAHQLQTISHALHRRFVLLVIASYILAGFAPGPGLWIRSTGLAGVSLPMIMLGVLLFNAGLGVELAELKEIRRRPRSLIVGLLANLVIPIGFVGLVMQSLRIWHNPDEVQNVLVGLALVASMPIAGSSTAWSQNANGNMALSLALVLGSTFLSPLTTPLGLHAVGLMTTGDYSEDLHELATTGTNSFLAVAVIIPSALGLVGHWLAGAERVARVKPDLKLVNLLLLLVLNYSNAAVSLPESVANPDPDFLAMILAITVLLCSTNFGAGWLIARLLGVSRADQIALMFGLGMNNNGTGLVLASMALADHPRVLLPIIFYNLVQHLVAGAVDYAVSRRRQVEDAPSRE